MLLHVIASHTGVETVETISVVIFRSEYRALTPVSCLGSSRRQDLKFLAVYYDCTEHSRFVARHEVSSFESCI